MDDYGRDLGVAFQIADDVLDLWGEERATGKSLGTDLEKQKLTLPLIRLLETSDPRGRRVDPPAPRRGQARGPAGLRDLLDRSEALAYAWEQAERFADRAAAALDLLPESPARPSSGP